MITQVVDLIVLEEFCPEFDMDKIRLKNQVEEVCLDFRNNYPVAGLMGMILEWDNMKNRKMVRLRTFLCRINSDI